MGERLEVSASDPFATVLDVGAQIYNHLPDGNKIKETLKHWLKLGVELRRGRLSLLSLRVLTEGRKIADYAAAAGWWMILLDRAGFKHVRPEVNPWTYGGEFMNFARARRPKYRYVVYELTDKHLDMYVEEKDDVPLVVPPGEEQAWNRISHAKAMELAQMGLLELLDPFEALYFFVDVVQSQSEGTNRDTLMGLDLETLRGKFILPVGPTARTHDDEDDLLMRTMFAVPPKDAAKGIVQWDKLGRGYPNKGWKPGVVLLGKRSIG